MSADLYRSILNAERNFSDSKYSPIVEKAKSFYQQGDHAKCLEALDQLPDPIDLLNSLVETLKQKPVYKNLKKISEGKCFNDHEMLTGLSSLMTHVFIKLEHGQGEYRVLARQLHERISKLMIQLNV